MRLLGVHGFYKAIKAAEEGPHHQRMATEKHLREQARAELVAARKATPQDIPQKLMSLASSASIADECKITGIIQMKRIHCLKYQLGSVHQAARRQVVSEDGESFGIHHRYRLCLTCGYWLTDEEWKQARHLLEASGGWDQFQTAASGCRRAGTARRSSEAA